MEEKYPIKVSQSFGENLTEQESRASACVMNLITTSNAIVARLDVVFRQYGMSRTESKILNILREAGEALPPHVLSEKLGVTRGAVTQLLDSLAERALIKRTNHPHDRRMLLVQITAAGRDVLHQSKPDFVNEQVKCVAALSPEEQDLFVNMLGRIQTSLQNSSEVS